jgi:hypothetical protein
VGFIGHWRGGNFGEEVYGKHAGWVVLRTFR